MPSTRRYTVRTRRSARGSAMADVLNLFDDYCARWARGERPDVREYRARAGEGAEELGGMIDLFLQTAEAPPASDEGRAVVAALVRGDSPLLELRTRRGVTRNAVVEFLLSRFSLDTGK